MGSSGEGGGGDRRRGVASATSGGSLLSPPITPTGQDVLNTLDSRLLSAPSWNRTGGEGKRERKGKAEKAETGRVGIKEWLMSQSEVSQKEKNKYHILTHIYAI